MTPQAEWIMWNGISKGCMTHGADEMLAALREKGIRTGIISNLCWSDAALKRRLKQFFPEHDFEFVVTSSAYIFRKPEPHIFDIAVRKSGLHPDEIWYCGNDVACDVRDAHGMGIFPVFYDGADLGKTDGTSVDFPHLRIENWMELSAYIT